MVLPEQSPSVAVSDAAEPERQRQRNLFQGAFAYIENEPDERIKIPRLSIVEDLRQMVRDIHAGEKTIGDFWVYQDLHIDDPGYSFLGEQHPGLNVSGWRVFMALIDPLTYGRNIQVADGSRAPISRRS